MRDSDCSLCSLRPPWFIKPQREQRKQRNGAGDCRTVLRCVKLSATLCNDFIHDYPQNLRLPRFFGVIRVLLALYWRSIGTPEK